MARKKTIETEKLMQYLDQYRLANPGAKIKIPKFGKFLRDNGVEVPDYTIRRNKDIREYINAVNERSDETAYSELIGYKTVDVEAFISKNNTPVKLKQAIMELDRYYASVASRGAEAIKAKQDAMETVEKLEREMSLLKEKISKVQARRDRAEIRAKDQTIAKLKSILASYVYPDAANAILEREGILELESSIIPKENMEEKIIHADTKVEYSKFEALNELMDGFTDKE